MNRTLHKLYLLFLLGAQLLTSHSLAADILAVDDDLSTLRDMKSFLEMEGHKVVTTTDAEKALALMETLHFDGVISDYLMPGMNGAAFLTEVNRRFPQLQLILFSDHGDTEHLKLPFHYNHVRPIEIQKLEEAVAKMGTIPPISPQPSSFDASCAKHLPPKANDPLPFEKDH